jgi:hypothetical protein
MCMINNIEACECEGGGKNFNKNNNSNNLLVCNCELLGGGG